MILRRETKEEMGLEEERRWVSRRQDSGKRNKRDGQDDEESGFGGRGK